MAAVRARLRDAHIDYMKQNQRRILASGALLRDDGVEAYGGLIVLDTEDRQEIEAFVQSDPFWIGKLYTSYTASRWRKAFFNYKSHLG